MHMVTTAWIPGRGNPTFSRYSRKHGMIALGLICMRQRKVTHGCVELVV
jgi:hypothetical protein